MHLTQTLLVAGALLVAAACSEGPAGNPSGSAEIAGSTAAQDGSPASSAAKDEMTDATADSHAVGGASASATTMHIVDLTHAFDDDTIYWPTDTRGFRLEQLAHGHTEDGWFYAANAFCTAEHGGTHLDAPIHFYEDGLPVNELPLEDLVGPAVVIDISAKAAADPDYRITIADVERHESEHGRIPDGAIVLLRTGWSDRWPDVRAYLGDDTPGDASDLSFPSYGEEAARLLVESRGVSLLGVDTASIDYGRSTDFPVHRIAAARQVPGLENLTNLDALPPTGFTVIALPMKIAGGTGAPVRVVALLER